MRRSLISSKQRCNFCYKRFVYCFWLVHYVKIITLLLSPKNVLEVQGEGNLNQIESLRRKMIIIGNGNVGVWARHAHVVRDVTWRVKWNVGFRKARWDDARPTDRPFISPGSLASLGWAAAASDCHWRRHVTSLMTHWIRHAQRLTRRPFLLSTSSPTSRPCVIYYHAPQSDNVVRREFVLVPRKAHVCFLRFDVISFAGIFDKSFCPFVIFLY